MRYLGISSGWNLSLGSPGGAPSGGSGGSVPTSGFGRHVRPPSQQRSLFLPSVSRVVSPVLLPSATTGDSPGCPEGDLEGLLAGGDPDLFGAMLPNLQWRPQVLRVR